MTRLEIYGIALAVLAIAIVGAYFKGRQDEHRSIATRQLADNAKALEDAAKAATARAALDEAGRAKAEQFIADIDRGIASVQTKFAKLPTVVLDARGCPSLTDAARLRWNAVELLPTGSIVDAAGGAPGAVPAGPVPAP